jgi:MarR-like DNA-binding transcriptional regulator SgrR of sgrS sRNA
MMELALNNGQQKNALELAQLATEELKALLSPFLGGQWQNNTPTLRIPTIARWTLCAGVFTRPRRAASCRANFSGLTRFEHKVALRSAI